MLAALAAIGRGSFAVRDCKHQLSELWVQALSEATEDTVLRKHLRKHMREVHDFVADLSGAARRGSSAPTATPTPKRGSSSPAGSSAWSAAASASSTTTRSGESARPALAWLLSP